MREKATSANSIETNIWAGYDDVAGDYNLEPKEDNKKKGRCNDELVQRTS